MTFPSIKSVAEERGLTSYYREATGDYGFLGRWKVTANLEDSLLVGLMKGIMFVWWFKNGNWESRHKTNRQMTSQTLYHLRFE